MQRLFSLMAIGILAACSSLPKSGPARLSNEPDVKQITEIENSVRAALGRQDVTMEAIRLFDSPKLVVRPVAIQDLTDRVPGTPIRFRLMSDGASCWLIGRDGTRIDLPSGLSCERLR